MYSPAKVELNNSKGGNGETRWSRTTKKENTYIWFKTNKLPLWHRFFRIYFSNSLWYHPTPANTISYHLVVSTHEKNTKYPTSPCQYCIFAKHFGLQDYQGLGRLEDSIHSNFDLIYLHTWIESKTWTILNWGVQRFWRMSKQILPSLYTRQWWNNNDNTIGVEEMIYKFNIRNCIGIVLWKLNTQEKCPSFPRSVIGATIWINICGLDSYPIIHASQRSILSRWIRQVIPLGLFFS